MPFFRTTKDIIEPWQNEAFDENWMNSNTIVLPPSKYWDYKRELRFEDVEVWEVIYEASGGIGVYAAWEPYAEFYLVSSGWVPGTASDRILDAYYGKNAQKRVAEKMKELNIPFSYFPVWVEDKDMWLFS